MTVELHVKGEKVRVTENQIAALRQLIAAGGGVISSEWTQGHGNHISSRAIPPFAKRIYSGNIWGNRIANIFKRHPRCHSVVAVVNMRAANRAVRIFEQKRKEDRR